MINITLNKIRACHPCEDGWAKLLRHLGKTKPDDVDFPLSVVIDSNGLDDALWCLRCLPEYDREWRLFAVWCARKVQSLMTDDRSISAINVAERFANGNATREELEAARAAAGAAAGAAWAAWAETGEAAWEAAWTAAWTAAGEAAWTAARTAARAAAGAETGAAWAAWAETGEAAWSETGEAAWSAARAAAWTAAREAAFDEQEIEFRRLISED